jgi:hypothetical protein
MKKPKVISEVFSRQALKMGENASDTHNSDQKSATEKGTVGVTLHTQSYGSRESERKLEVRNEIAGFPV